MKTKFYPLSVIYLSEGPVVCGRLEGGHGPLLEHGPRHHGALHLLEDLPEHLVTGLAAPGLDGAQPLVIPGYRVVVVLLPLGAPTLVDGEQ